MIIQTSKLQVYNKNKKKNPSPLDYAEADVILFSGIVDTLLEYTLI